MLLHSSPIFWVALHFSDKVFPRSREFWGICIWHPGWKKNAEDQHASTADEAASTTCGSSTTVPGVKNSPCSPTHKMQHGDGCDYSVGSLTCSDVIKKCPQIFHVYA